MRGALVNVYLLQLRSGITPAHAGSTSVKVVI